MRVSKKDIMMIAQLRENARETLTKMSRRTGIPVSTLYDRLQAHNGRLIKKFTSILDFRELGFSIRANMLIGVDYEDRQKLRDFLEKAYNANSVQTINNDYDYFVEGIFKDIPDLEAFKEKLHATAKISRLQIYIVADEIKKEQFLSGKELGYLTAS